MTRTALYRHWSGENLLYVGISVDPVKRLREHDRHSIWMEDVDQITIEWFDTREAALTAERNAIRSEVPIYNVQHARSSYPMPIVVEKAPSGPEILTPAQVSALTGCRVETVAKALRDRELKGGQRRVGGFWLVRREDALAWAGRS